MVPLILAGCCLDMAGADVAAFVRDDAGLWCGLNRRSTMTLLAGSV